MLTPKKEQQLRDFQSHILSYVDIFITKEDERTIAVYWLARMKEQQEELVNEVEKYRADIVKNYSNSDPCLIVVDEILNIINPKHE